MPWVARLTVKDSEIDQPLGATVNDGRRLEVLHDGVFTRELDDSVVALRVCVFAPGHVTDTFTFVRSQHADKIATIHLGPAPEPHSGQAEWAPPVITRCATESGNIVVEWAAGESDHFNVLLVPLGVQFPGEPFTEQREIDGSSRLFKEPVAGGHTYHFAIQRFSTGVFDFSASSAAWVTAEITVPLVEPLPPPPSPAPPRLPSVSSSFVVSPARGIDEVFFIRADGMVFTNGRHPRVNKGNWNSPSNDVARIHRSALANCGLASVISGPGAVEVFWVAPNGMVLTNGRSPAFNGGQWNGPINDVAPRPGYADPRSRLAVVSPLPGVVEAFWISPDGRVLTNARHPDFNGGRWGEPISDVAPNPWSADPRGGIAAVSPAPGIVEVFWIRSDGMVLSNMRHPDVNEGRWGNPINGVGPTPSSADPRSAIAAVSPVPGVVEVFWVRSDGMVLSNTRHPELNAGRWNNPINDVAPNPGSADPRGGIAAVCPAAGVVEVFWLRSDGTVLTNSRHPAVSNGRWNHPINDVAALPGSADPRSALAAVSHGPGSAEVYWVRSDGMVLSNSRHPDVNGGHWNHPTNDIAPASGSATVRMVA